ncbi:GNAT family N-acetyltransferase [uncultured Parabacteroides sp.]|uniref:GNAT family N-acetyltransferase n=1 Tax=uncultured Parabacteroides sp. TaxID=512312 RepID=UPI0025E681D3|nr:GNAT family N-acetyltransferase [uncultured Parabacteroides sp.]
MEIVRLTTSDALLYKAFRAIYDVSFPVFEQRTEIQQKDALTDNRYHLDCYVGKDTGLLQGFIAYWRFDRYTYVEHFAIHPDRRGKGLGGLILNNLIDQESGRVLLEIDPVVDNISAARLRFYQSYGFVENPFPHIHPAYRSEYPDHSLVVLSTEGEMTVSEYNKFASDLNVIVMKKGM